MKLLTILTVILILLSFLIGCAPPPPENNPDYKSPNPVQRETTGGEYIVYDYDVFKLIDTKNNIVCYGTLKGESNIQCFDLNSK